MCRCGQAKWKAQSVLLLTAGLRHGVHIAPFLWCRLCLASQLTLRRRHAAPLEARLPLSLAAHSSPSLLPLTPVPHSCPQGGSIASLLARFGPLPEPVIRLYTRQLLSGLAYLHAQRTMHRGAAPVWKALDVCAPHGLEEAGPHPHSAYKAHTLQQYCCLDAHS